MKRRHLIELEDQAWFPASVRRYLTDVLAFAGNAFAFPYAAFVPRLRAALDRTGDTELLDLCSGSGGPLPTLLAMLRADGGPPITGRATDLHPRWSPEARARVEAAGIIAEDRPIDATDVPPELPGFRLICNGFHHLPPPLATAVLADAVRQRRGIAVLEVIERSLPAMAWMLVSPAITLAVTPFIRPFEWRRLALTYAVPAVPLTAGFDGLVSCLRIYSPDDLRGLLAEVPDADTFDWQIERLPVAGTPVKLTTLIGVPRAEA